MSAFIDFLTGYLRTELKGALAAAPGRELRVFFSGPPSGILNEIFTSLLAGKENLTFDEYSVPIFLLDATAQDPDRLCSSRCSSSHLVKIRTSGCRVFLALIPLDELTNVSIDTTVTWVGTRSSARDFQTWMAHPMLRQLADAAVSRFFPGRQADDAKAALAFTLEEAWDMDESFKDQRNTWKVLRQLFDCQIEGASDEESFLSILGLPKCDSRDLGSTGHLRILSRIAEVVENGLQSGFSMLEEQADDEIRPYVTQFRQHILSTCLIPDDFLGAPTKHYSPINEYSLAEIPSWWRVLTVSVWNSLLDPSGGDPPPDQGLNAEFLDPIKSGVRGLPVLFHDKVAIQVSVSDETGPVTVRIRRASGAKKLEDVDSMNLMGGAPTEWKDTAPPPHDRHVRYELEASGFKRCTLKCIVLDEYAPGVVVYSRNAKRITTFKLNRKARDNQGRKMERYECDLALRGMGAHQLDLYKGKKVVLGPKVAGHEVTSDQSGVLERPINATDDHHAVCVIETDEDCYYDFDATPVGANLPAAYRIWITTEDQPPTGAASEFDRLLIEHSASANGDSANARVELAISRVTDFEIWALEDDNSFHPVVLGPDYLNYWRKPAWNERPSLSGHRLMLDPRPPLAEIQPPAELITARRRIQALLRPQPEEAATAIELIHLADEMAKPEFATAIADYLRCYIDWLHSDYVAAAWMDVVTIHRIEANGDVLEPVPAAILLTPLHPLRLAWQCRAQEVLKQALDRHMRCPGASVLDPCSFPDSFLLPCRSATGRIENHGYLSLASSSDYWTVLWNKDISLGNPTHVGKLPTPEGVFTPEFGILIEGLSSGFNVQQVRRSIEEVARLSSAKSTLQLSIESDTCGSSSCNEGIDIWCSSNLGADGDAWFEAGPRALHVHDHRPESLQPEQASLASLTAKTGATVRWFTPDPNQARQQSDLAIIAHLGVSSPGFQIEGLRAAVDPTGLTRHRIRKQLAATAGTFIAESRVGTVPRSADPTGLAGLLLTCVDKLESACAELFDSYVFAPKMPTLEEALQSARYCAVSSSTVDAACFFRATNDSYLWDYELPAYSRRAGENNGYYLLAKESTNILEAVQSAVRKIAPDAQLEPTHVSSLLHEISRRGMPTLKRLTCGGATSLGEIGMLVALRLLQSEFQASPTGLALCPVREGKDILNLLIPADPFKNHFEDLQSATQHRCGERPDLIIASVRFVAGKPVGLKLTAIEVKARSDVFSQNERVAALFQASSFAQFLVEVQARAKEVTVWSIAWRNLVASWFDYAFRVYGQLDSFMQQQEWTRLHGEVLQELMSENLDIEIDTRGRLIVIDHSNTSAPLDMDNDRFNETVILTHTDAYALLGNGNSDILSRIKDALGDWEFSPTGSQGQNGPVQPTSAPTHTSSIPLSPSSGEPSLTDEPLAPPASPSPRDADSSPGETIPNAQPNSTPPVAPDPSGIKFAVGSSIGAFQQHDLQFFPGNTELNQLNVGIVGDLGTGKTQLIQSLLYQLRAHPENNRGLRPKILIFDYKKDYSKAEFVKATGARVVSPFSIPLNIFDIRDSAGHPNAWLERSKFFTDVLAKIFSGIGSPQRHHIKQAVRQSFERANAAGLASPTIYDVFECYAQLCEGEIDSPYSIMSDIVDSGYFVRDPQQIQRFSEFLDGVVVIDLAAVGQDDRTKNMLVVIFLNLFYEHMLKIEKKQFLGQGPKLRYVDTMLLVDEADNIMKYEFDVLKRVLLQGREFGVGVVLASQYLSHFKTKNENYGEPLLTWFVHKVPNITVRELEGVGLTRVDVGLVERIKTLGCHECLYKTFDVGGEFMRAKPFYELIEH